MVRIRRVLVPRRDALAECATHAAARANWSLKGDRAPARAMSLKRARPEVVSPLHVLSIVHSATFGGPHNQAVHLHASSVGSGGPSVSVLLPDEPGNAAERLHSAGVPVMELPLLRPRASRRQQSILGLLRGYPRQIRRLRQLISDGGFDVVEVHGLLNVDGAIAGRLEGRGVVWQLIDSRPPRILRWLMMPIVIALADVIMTTGDSLASEYPGARFRPSRLLSFIPPVRVTAPAATDLEVAGAHRQEARQLLQVDDAAVLIVGIGNLNPQKGFEVLIDAVGACRAELPGIELRIRGGVQVGHEAYRDTLVARARTLGMSPETVTELRDGLGVSDLLMSADVFALSSRPRSEGLPTVILEAMAASLPVVATDVGSVSDVVHGATGTTVAPDDVPALTRALMALVANPTERERLGKSGRELVENIATPGEFAAVHQQAYERAVQHHAGHQPGRG